MFKRATNGSTGQSSMNVALRAGWFPVRRNVVVVIVKADAAFFAENNVPRVSTVRADGVC
jgi:hypothetical protein